MQANSRRSQIVVGFAVAFLAAAVQYFIVRRFWGGLDATINLFLAVVALLYGINGALNVARLGRRRLTAYVLSYVALFVFFMVFLGGAEHRALVFAIFAMFLSAFFHLGVLLGYFVIVLAAYFLFPLYALPVVVILSLFYTLLLQVRRAARKSDNYLLTAFFAISLLFVLIVFFPLLHFVAQRAPQDLTKTLFSSGISDQVQDALVRSLVTSSISTGIAFLLGLPLAYVLVRADFRGKSILDVAIDIPILIPPPIVAIALIMLVGSKTSFGLDIKRAGDWLAGLFGGEDTLIGSMLSDIKFDGSTLGIIFAQVLVSSSFFVRSAMTAIRGVEARLEYVSRTLGAGPLRTFLLITLPLAARGIFIGCILAWARAISEFGAIQLIAYKPFTGPTLIYDLYQSKGGAEGASATVAILMTVICLAIFCVLHVLASRLIWKRD
jgi:molybdate/tungstate transport system permease protein